MKTLILILAMLPLFAIGQLKYECYVFVDEAEFIQTLSDEGFEYETLKTDFQIYKNGEKLDVHYEGIIITNKPRTDSTWTPSFSTEVYVLAARKGSVKLPSTKKVRGLERQYYHEFINHFSGEYTPED